MWTWALITLDLMRHADAHQAAVGVPPDSPQRLSLASGIALLSQLTEPAPEPVVGE